MLTDELLSLIKSRRSIRKFSTETVSDKEIIQLIDAARYAPSSSNRQPWRFLIVKNEQKKNDIIEKVRLKIERVKSSIKDEDLSNVFKAYEEYFLFINEAPILIFSLYKNPPSILLNLLSEMQPESINKNHSGELISVAMAMQNILLAAHASGLGACLTTGPLLASEEIKNLLDIRPPFEIAAIIAVGRYSEIPASPARKSVQDIIEVIE